MNLWQRSASLSRPANAESDAAGNRAPAAAQERPRLSLEDKKRESAPQSKRAFPFREGEHYAVDSTGCWLWQGYTDPQGYGRCQIERLKRAAGTARAHRIGWILLHGPLDPRVSLHHTCRNPKCVNPGHLEPLTMSEHRRLHRHEESKLTEADVVYMRDARAAGATLEELAERFETTFSNVGYICRGKSWASAPGPIEPPTSRCGACGARFVQRTALAKYCSPACKDRTKVARQREQRQMARRAA